MNCSAYWDQACEELAHRDDTMSRLIDRHGDERLRGSGDAFRTLVNAIVGQQISVAAAESIWTRLIARAHPLSPDTILSLDREELRSTGLSFRKIEYIQGIAHAFATETINPAGWPRMSDDAIRTELVALRGVGPWTAEMMLIFYLQRPDILPLGDIGLVNGASRLYGWDSARDIRERTAMLKDHARLWSPWRTVATWFIWRDLDAEPVVY